MAQSATLAAPGPEWCTADRLQVLVVHVAPPELSDKCPVVVLSVHHSVWWCVLVRAECVSRVRSDRVLCAQCAERSLTFSTVTLDSVRARTLWWQHLAVRTGSLNWTWQQTDGREIVNTKVLKCARTKLCVMMGNIGVKGATRFNNLASNNLNMGVSGL